MRDIVDRVGNAVRWILGFSLLAGALVLAAALAASAAERRHEAALLRTLGARRGQLRVAAACEFALLGLVAGLTAALGAAGAGWWLGRAVFHIDGFVPPLWPLRAMRSGRGRGGDAAGPGRHAQGHAHLADAPAARRLMAPAR